MWGIGSSIVALMLPSSDAVRHGVGRAAIGPDCARLRLAALRMTAFGCRRDADGYVAVLASELADASRKTTGYSPRRTRRIRHELHGHSLG